MTPIGSLDANQLKRWEHALVRQFPGIPPGYVLTEQDWIDNDDDITPWMEYEEHTPLEMKMGEASGLEVAILQGLTMHGGYPTTTDRHHPDVQSRVPILRRYREKILEIRSFHYGLRHLVAHMTAFINEDGGLQQLQDLACDAVLLRRQPVMPWTIWDREEWPTLFTAAYHDEKRLLFFDANQHVDARALPVDVPNTHGRRPMQQQVLPNQRRRTHHVHFPQSILRNGPAAAGSAATASTTPAASISAPTPSTSVASNPPSGSITPATTFSAPSSSTSVAAPHSSISMPPPHSISTATPSTAGAAALAAASKRMDQTDAVLKSVQQQMASILAVLKGGSVGGPQPSQHPPTSATSVTSSSSTSKPAPPPPSATSQPAAPGSIAAAAAHWGSGTIPMWQQTFLDSHPGPQDPSRGSSSSSSSLASGATPSSWAASSSSTSGAASSSATSGAATPAQLHRMSLGAGGSHNMRSMSQFVPPPVGAQQVFVLCVSVGALGALACFCCAPLRGDPEPLCRCRCRSGHRVDGTRIGRRVPTRCGRRRSG